VPRRDEGLPRGDGAAVHTDAPMLIESKLHAPRPRPDTVARTRLENRIDPGDLPVVTVVSAPAGSGKSTFLAAWIQSARAQGRSVAWVALDRRDGDPVLFWSYVLTAVERAVPGSTTATAARIAAADSADGAVVASLANDLAALDDELVVVLDDYHRIESLAVHESLRSLIDVLPGQVHLVVAGRADPPWPLSGLRARGQLVEVRAADLRFTPEETSAYLNDSMGLGLAQVDVDALVTRTEGWVAALQLVAISLRGRDDPSAFVAEFAGDDRHVMDYLLDEVLERQPVEIRDFLLRTSILSRFSAPLCAAVADTPDAADLIGRIDRSNLFLVALDDRRRWFRYHHLFADVLRIRLDDEQPDLVPELHRRAAEYFERDGDRAEALRHALAAGQVAKAAELVELATPVLRRSRQDATLAQWLDALPPEVFANRPVLNLARVGARMVRGDTTGVAGLLDTIEAWSEPGHGVDDPIVHDVAEYARVPAQTAMYRAGLAMLQGDPAGAIAHGRRAAQLAAPDDHTGRGAAVALVGLARWTTGDLLGAAEEYRGAIGEFRAAAHFADVLGCSLGLADQLTGLGRLAAAEDALTTALDIAADHGPLRGSADMHIGLAEIHLARYEPDAALARLGAGRADGDHLALGQYAYRRRVVEARICALAGDHDRALALLAEAQRHYDTDYSPRVRPVAATTARVQLAAGDRRAARRWAGDAGVSVTDEASYLGEYEHLTLARLLLAEHEPAVIGLLRRLVDAARRGGREGSAAEAAMLLALALDADGARDEALATLGEAVDAAAPERLFGMFVESGGPVGELLDAMVRAGISTANGRELSAEVRRGARHVVRPDSALVDPLSARETEVLRLLRSELSGPQIAAELFISLNTFRSHTKRIFTKLDVSNRRAAVARADQLGL